MSFVNNAKFVNHSDIFFSSVKIKNIYEVYRICSWDSRTLDGAAVQHGETNLLLRPTYVNTVLQRRNLRNRRKNDSKCEKQSLSIIRNTKEHNTRKTLNKINESIFKNYEAFKMLRYSFLLPK